MATRGDVLRGLYAIMNPQTDVRTGVWENTSAKNQDKNIQRYDEIIVFVTSLYDQFSRLSTGVEVQDARLTQLFDMIQDLEQKLQAWARGEPDAGKAVHDASDKLKAAAPELVGRMQQRTAPPNIMVTQASTADLRQDKRSNTEQKTTSNAINILTEMSKTIVANKTMVGVLRLSGDDSVAKQKFDNYSPLNLITATNPQPVTEWGNKPDVSDVISTMKRFFNPTNSTGTKKPMTGLELGRDISKGFIASEGSLAYLSKELPASHLAMLKIVILMMQQVAAESETNKMTPSNCAIAANGLLSTITGLGDDVKDIGQQMAAMQALNTAATKWVENAQDSIATIDAAIQAKHQQGDYSDAVYTSEAQLTPPTAAELAAADDFVMVSPSTSPTASDEGSSSRSRSASGTFKSAGKAVMGTLKAVGAIAGNVRGRSNSMESSGSGSTSPKEKEVVIGRPDDATASGGTMDMLAKQKERDAASATVSAPNVEKSSYTGTTVSLAEAQARAAAAKSGSSTPRQPAPPPPGQKSSTSSGLFANPHNPVVGTGSAHEASKLSPPSSSGSKSAPVSPKGGVNPLGAGGDGSKAQTELADALAKRKSKQNPTTNNNNNQGPF